MVDSVFKFSLDIHQAKTQEMFSVKRGDTKRRLEIILTEKGEPYFISNDCYAVFSAEKADGHKIYNDCEIEDNTIVYHMTPQTVAVVGILKCEIKLYGEGDSLITSPRFTVVVDPTINEEDEIEIESADEVNALTQLLGEVSAVKAEVEYKLENGEFIGEQGPQGIQGPEGKQGPKGEQGIQGEQGNPGKDGGFYVPSVSEDGKLFWFRSNAELPAPPSANIMGPQGPQGKTGPQGKQGPKGDKGDSGDDYVLTEEDKKEIAEMIPSGGVSFETDETLFLENGVLGVNTATDVEGDNTLPITSAAVYETVGNIEILLKTI